MTSPNPIVLHFGDLAGNPDSARLEFLCRFLGFDLIIRAAPGENGLDQPDEPAPVQRPVLVVISATELAGHPKSHWQLLQADAGHRGIPLAVLGIGPECDPVFLAQFAGGGQLGVTTLGTGAGSLKASSTDADTVGFELRGLRLGLGPGPTYSLDYSGPAAVRVMAVMSPEGAGEFPVLLRLERDRNVMYLLTVTGDPDRSWPAQRQYFGQIVPLLLMLRDAGGMRCWHSPGAVANLTIDDPWLHEPYGCLSYPGLLAEMKRENFHATIGFVPWNYDRNSPEVVSLIRDHPEHFSIAVHGNNHDRYEFYRYAAREGDQQRPKPLAQQAYNIRQAVARMAEFRALTGLEYDRVMVFPHGVCPAATFQILKQEGFCATFNYSNVPLGEGPPADPAAALRSVNTEWYGFPALRRNYPQNLSDEAIAIDLFLGNPVLFMAHQDLFFAGIDAFNAHARRINARQPAVRWMSLGEITRHLHQSRWLSDDLCEVRLESRHARIENTRLHPAEFYLHKREPAPETIERITLDGKDIPWVVLGVGIQVRFPLAAGAKCLAEIHYRATADATPVELRRSGLRNRALRLIADFRDLSLSRSIVGRFLTRKYYRPGKKRPTFSSLAARLNPFRRRDRQMRS